MTGFKYAKGIAYSKGDLFHIAKPQMADRPLCSMTIKLDDKSMADSIPAAATLCMNCKRRLPYYEAKQL